MIHYLVYTAKDGLTWEKKLHWKLGEPPPPWRTEMGWGGPLPASTPPPLPQCTRLILNIRGDNNNKKYKQTKNERRAI
jgi:hypothetical protein